MINMLEPWQPKGWRKPRKSMNRTWSTGPKSFPTRTTLTEVKRFCKYQLKKGQFDLRFFFKQGKESTIIIFPFFFWPCIKMWEPYRNFNYYQISLPMSLFSPFRLMNYFDFYTCFCFPDEIEVACLKTIKKDDLIMFFKVHAHTNHMLITLYDFDILKKYIGT